MKKSIQFLLACTLLLVGASLHAAKLYRWVDKDGNVHYSDKVPPEAAQQEREVLNEQGITTDKLDRQLTDEEIAEKARLAEEQAAKEAEEEERRQHDQMLRQSYTTVADMEDARDGRVNAIESQILVTSRTIETLEQRLGALVQRAARLRQDNGSVPEELQNQMKNTEAELLENQRFLMARRQEQDEIRAEFDANINRFKELTGQE